MFTLIDSVTDLNILNKELSAKTKIGIDTEFRRTTKTNMKLALLQINDGEEIYLVDPLSIGDPGENCSFLHSKSVQKIIHSCREDLEAIYSWTGKKIVNVFDTQIANSFLGGMYSISYQSLVKEQLDIILDKGETRSNWIRRPLTDSQLKYATSDVEYLIHLFEKQNKALKSSKKDRWAKEEIEFTVSKSLDYNENLAYSRIISKNEEETLLQKFNEMVHSISIKENINQTLFFSKRLQKEFLRKIFTVGYDDAFNEITKWRGELLRKPLSSLFD